MNLPEFKAWFEGFTENLDTTPNAKQWKRIQAKVAEIKDAPPTTYPVFLDRWVGPHWPHWIPYWNWTTTNVGITNNSLAVGTSALKDAEVQRQIDEHGSAVMCFNSSEAFRELGRVEARNWP